MSDSQALDLPAKPPEREQRLPTRRDIAAFSLRTSLDTVQQPDSLQRVNIV
jgi:hypothetical protein